MAERFSSCRKKGPAGPGFRHDKIRVDSDWVDTDLSSPGSGWTVFAGRTRSTGVWCSSRAPWGGLRDWMWMKAHRLAAELGLLLLLVGSGVKREELEHRLSGSEFTFPTHPVEGRLSLCPGRSDVLLFTRSEAR